jgi:hypothetical protein
MATVTFYIYFIEMEKSENFLEFSVMGEVYKQVISNENKISEMFITSNKTKINNMAIYCLFVHCLVHVLQLYQIVET